MSTPAITLLIIDDSPEDRFAMRVYLSDSSLADCIVHEADSGKRGLAAIQHLQPDCVLLDYRLADMNGFEFLDAIRAPSGDPIFAVIILTGSGDEAVAGAAMRAGAQDYLPKDLINGKSLSLTIRKAIDRFALIQSRREHEDKLRRLTEELEDRVTKEVAAREVAYNRLSQAQRMEALGQLAGGIAHDFNNILQAVSGGLALIQRRANDPDAVRRFAGLAASAAERGATITGRLLTFARSGKLISEAISPFTLLEDQREMLSRTFGPSITITIEADSRLPLLCADKGQLETVLVNLAVNARDAMPAGGALTMRIQTAKVANGTIHLAGLIPGDYLALTVVDTGVGMDADTLARASEPFFTTKSIGNGTGLGLAMARGFAQQSGGGFAIHSTLGKGTTVTLWFPIAIVMDSSLDHVVADPIISVTARILLVDDDPLVIDVVAGFLSDEGHHVTQAPSGFAALERLNEGEVFELLITDFAMPGMNGVVLIDEVRLRHPNLPVLLLTGYVNAGVQVNIDHQLHNIIGVLRKPFSAASLLERVAQLLHQDVHMMDATLSNVGVPQLER